MVSTWGAAWATAWDTSWDGGGSPVVEAGVWHGRRRKEETRRKAWPLPPPHFPLEPETPAILTTGTTPQTEAVPQWVLPRHTKPAGRYRGLVYRPPVDIPRPSPAVPHRVVRQRTEQIAAPLDAEDASVVAQRRQRQRQEDAFILDLLMHGRL